MTTSDKLFEKLLKEAPCPEPPHLRGGETVCVAAEGVLRGRTGTVTGFTEANGRRLAFVRWPNGGFTTVAETSLQRVKGRR